MFLRIVSEGGSWNGNYIQQKKTFNPLPDDKILDRSKLKQIANDILKCIENGK